MSIDNLTVPGFPAKAPTRTDHRPVFGTVSCRGGLIPSDGSGTGNPRDVTPVMPRGGGVGVDEMVVGELSYEMTKCKI